MSIYYNSKPVDIDTTFDPTSENAVSGVAVKEAIDEAVQSMYRPGGSILFSNLPVLSADVLGFVYNITDAFTTDARFVEGAGTECAAGTNVVVVNTGTEQNPVYKFDIFAVGAVQVQSDWTQTDTSAVDYIKNKPTIPTVNDATLTISQNGVLKGTFSANSSTNVAINLDGGSTTAEEIVNANEATGATSPLKVWQGTEQEWTNGVGTNWYNWRTDVALTSNTSVGNIRTSDYPTKVVYGNSVYLAKSEYIGSSGSSSTYYYSTDGINWSSKTLPGNAQSIAFGNGLFVAAGVYSTNIYTSENGIDWTTRTVSKYAQGNDVVCNFVNGRFYITSSSGYTGVIYSDDGIDWTYLNESSKGHFYLYGNGMYVATDKGSSTVYTSLDGFTWTSHNIYEKIGSTTIRGITYGNNLFVIVTGLNIYTTTDFETITYRYQNVLQPNTSYPAFGDGKFVIVGQYSNGTRTIGYSDTGIKWKATTISQTSSNGTLDRGAYYANGYFFVSGYMSSVNRLTFDQSQVYTLDSTPTTSSMVYSSPNTASALTITSIGTGTITLSDNNTYTYNQSGDEVTYQSIGEAHPNYLANINGVGVKIGNTLIADNTDTSALQTKSNLVTSVSSSSTDTQYPSAKLLYDTVGNIEATLDAIIAQGSNS